MINRADDYPAFVTYPGLPRRIRKVGAPIGVIIVLGTVTGLIVIGLTAVNPVGTGIGFALSSVAMTIVVLAYLWLDRWEPEPPRLLVLAFLWGASVAVVISTILQLTIEAEINPGHLDTVSPWSVALGAPLTEEAAKGLFLLLMMTGRRRNELNSLTDCLVYAGLVGVGFAWLEDILYIGGGASVSESLATAALRLIMAPFAHSLFTSMTGIGVYFALKQRNALAKALCILLGYVGAVIMHGLWNGSSLLSVEAYFLTYLFWMAPIFVLVIALGVSSRRSEQRVVAEKLPGMVAAGLVAPNEATWLGSLRSRKSAIRTAKQFGGKPAAKSVKNFAAQVVELAFVRDRIDRGFGDQRVYALQQEEVNEVAAARAAAPALHQLAGYRAP
ncbi:PrsW family intramembrane metalloprotease [Mycolicibacterium moriokaense]